MRKQLEQVEEFNTLFRAGVKNKPTILPLKDCDLRYNLLKEENEEYLKACKDSDLVEIADALGDQLYIVLGTIVNHGMQNIIEDVFEAIHLNNLSKLGEDGNPIINGENGILDETRPIGKVLKPKSYKPVDLTEIVNKG